VLDDFRDLLHDPDPRIASLAKYLAALLGDAHALQALVQSWQTNNTPGRWYVYRAIAVMDDPQYVPVLRKIYERTYQKRPAYAGSFYWTIRIMSGPEILELRRQIHGPSHPEVAESLDLLADLELAEGHYQSADTLFRTAVEMRRHELGPSDYWVAESLVGLGITQKELEQYDEAEDSFLEALDIRERTGADSLRISELWDNLATVYYHQGEVDLAEPLYRRTLAIRRTELGSESILVAQSLNNLAPTLEALEKYTEAESLYREAMNIYRESLGPESGHLANTMVNLAILLEEELNEYDEAELLYEGAIRIGESLYSDENVIVAGWRRAYGGFLCVVQEKSADGATQIRAALPILEREYSPGSEQVVAARSMLGYCLTDLGEFEQAEEQLLRTLYDSQSGLGPDHSRTQQARERLVRLYEAWERPEQADEYRSETEAQSSEP
jgi:tetratricopeptide (TPR) repeat protein